RVGSGRQARLRDLRQHHDGAQHEDGAVSGAGCADADEGDRAVASRVSLRLQLLVFGLLTLVLPWTAIRYVEEMEAALRGGLEQSLVASATTGAAALEEQGASLCAAQPCSDAAADARGATIYAAPLAAEPIIDGVRDDWNVADDAAVVLPGERRVYAGVHG